MFDSEKIKNLIDELRNLEKKSTTSPWWREGKYQLYGPISEKKKNFNDTRKIKQRGEKIAQARANQQYRWYPNEQDTNDIDLMIKLRNNFDLIIAALKRYSEEHDEE